MANDLGFDVMKKAKIKNTFRIICLNDNSSVMTAISNDTGYENIFLGQLKMQFKKGDSVLVFSASGNSPNLIKETEPLENTIVSNDPIQPSSLEEVDLDIESGNEDNIELKKPNQIYLEIYRAAREKA